MASLNDEFLNVTDGITKSAVEKLDIYLSEFKKELSTNKTTIDTILSTLPEKSTDVQPIDKEYADKLFKSCKYYDIFGKRKEMENFGIKNLIPGEYLIYVYYDDKYVNKHILLFTNFGTVLDLYKKYHGPEIGDNGTDYHNTVSIHKFNTHIPRTFDLTILEGICSCEYALKDTKYLDKIGLIMKTIKTCALDAVELYEKETKKIKDDPTKFFIPAPTDPTLTLPKNLSLNLPKPEIVKTNKLLKEEVCEPVKQKTNTAFITLNSGPKKDTLDKPFLQEKEKFRLEKEAFEIQKQDFKRREQELKQQEDFAKAKNKMLSEKLFEIKRLEDELNGKL